MNSKTEPEQALNDYALNFVRTQLIATQMEEVMKKYLDEPCIPGEIDLVSAERMLSAFDRGIIDDHPETGKHVDPDAHECGRRSELLSPSLDT